LLRPRGGSRHQVESGCALSYPEDFALWPFLAVFAATIVAVSVAATEGLIRMFSPLFSRHTMAHPNARAAYKVPTPQDGGILVIAVILYSADRNGRW
jgi:hypothetical protein